MSPPLTPDPETAIAFLTLMRPGGPWVLTAVTPDGPTTTETFTKPEAMGPWIVRENKSRNIYWMVAEATGILRKKATKDDVAQTVFLWADVDGQPNGHAAAPPPTAIVASGGGTNMYWSLSGPIQDKDKIEAHNRWLAKELDADPSCWNVDRILRVPSTVNWPNAKKRSQGRKPVMAGYTDYRPERIYDLGAFGQVEAGEAKAGPGPDLGNDIPLLTPDDLPAELREKLPVWACRLISDGPQPGEYRDDRSRAVFAVVFALVRADATDAHIAGLLLNPAVPLSAHIRDQKGHKPRAYIARQIERARTKVEAEREAEANGNEDPWPDLDLSLTQSHRRPAPTLDLSVFGPFWARWIGDAAEAKGAPVDFVAMPLIAAAGAMIANCRRASPWPGWVEPPIIWQANVGLPSSGKSPALDAVTTDLLALLERDLDSDFDERHHDDLIQRARCKARRDVWEQAVKVAIKKGLPPPDPPHEIEPPAAPTRRRLITNNATIEQLSRLCAVNDRGLILCRDELAGWIGQMDKYGGNGADRATFIEAHGGRSCVIDRVKEGSSIRVPYFSVSIIGGIQPDRLATMLLHGDDDGLTARLLLSWPEPRRPVRPKRHPDNVAALVALRWLLALAPDQVDDVKMPRVLPLTPQAADRLQEWRVAVADMETQAAGLFLSWLGKLPGMAVRIATCLEMLWWSAMPMGTTEPAVISDGAVAAAVSLLSSYSIPMARRTFGEAALPQADRDAIALARWLLAQPTLPSVVNARDLRHADAIPTREPGRYDAALGELAQAGWVMPAPRGSGPGRTRKDWLVNPKLKAAAHAA